MINLDWIDLKKKDSKRRTHCVKKKLKPYSFELL